MSVEIITADALEALPRLAADGFRAHAVVTDPPYHLTSGNQAVDWSSMGPNGSKRPTVGQTNGSGRKAGFMGQQWDGGDVAFRVETWAAVRDCMLPGAHLVAFGGSRTFHRMVCAIEDAGFEIRDTLMWVYGSGFPKSRDVSQAIDRAAGAEREVVGESATRVQLRDHSANSHGGWRGQERTSCGGVPITAPATPEAAAWAGWGTALKPSYEPIVLARRSLSERNVAANVLRHGTGAINVDACRVGTTKDVPASPCTSDSAIYGKGSSITTGDTAGFNPNIGRWPANLLHDGSPEVEQAFAVFGERSSGQLKPEHQARGGFAHPNCYHAGSTKGGDGSWDANTGSASRFFFCAKADASDRQGSKHPTVKPASLMRWLVRLVCPEGGTVLDPFAGTGSTGLAADQLGMNAVLIERDAQYAADARHKIERDGGLFSDVREPCQMAAEPPMRDLFSEAAD